jgi:hypothetical protein
MLSEVLVDLLDVGGESYISYEGVIAHSLKAETTELFLIDAI